MESFVSWLLSLVFAYILAGCAAAVVLHLRLNRLDTASIGSGWFFRILITPGMIALWPLLTLAWMRMAPGRPFAASTEGAARMGRLRQIHGILVMVVTVLVALAVALALAARPGPPASSGLPQMEHRP